MGRGDLGHMEGIMLPQGGFSLLQLDWSLPFCRLLCWTHASQPAQAELCLRSKTGSSGNSLKTSRVITIDKNTQRVQKVKLEFIHSHKFSHCHNMWGFLASCKLQVWILTVLDLPALMRFLWPLLPCSRFSSLVRNATVFYHIMPWYHATAWPKTNLWMGSRNIYFTCFLWLQDLNLSWYINIVVRFPFAPKHVTVLWGLPL